MHFDLSVVLHFIKHDNMGELYADSKIEIDGRVYSVQPLHRKPSFIDDCCKLINLEWKRSVTARKRSIEGSCENFPMSLLLLKHGSKTEVVGHCKMSKMPLCNRNVFIETVVIHPQLRGKGLGKFLMKEAERMAKRKNIDWIYLSTKGQEVFYEKLGYCSCPPFSIYGSHLSENNGKMSQFDSEIHCAKLSALRKPEEKKVHPPPLSTPPPPPMPQDLSGKILPLKVQSSKTFMRKKIS